MSDTKRALRYTITSQYLVLSVQFVSTIIVARLLSPGEIGVYSVAAAIIGIGHLLRDFGSGQYIIQEQELTEQRIRAALSVTLLFGWGMALLIWTIAPAAATYYDHADLDKILSLLALNFCLLPFGSIALAYCSRNMNFRPSALANIGSTLANSTIAVLLAYLGFSYMSLVWASLAGTVTSVLIAVLLRPAGLPMLPGFRDFRRVFGFGGKMSFVELLGEVATITPELVLGKFHSFHAVGLFSRTQGIAGLFQHLVIQGVSPVIASVFAKQKREDGDAREAYLYATICVSGLAWPFYAGLAIVASPFVDALFGPKWSEIVPLLQLWCVGAILHQFTALADPALVNVGEVNRLVKFSVMLQPIRILCLAVAATVSLEAVVMVIAIVPIIRFALLWPHLRAVFNMGFRDYMNVVFRSGVPAVAGVLAVLVMQYVLVDMGIEQNFVLLAACGVAGIAGWYLVAHSLGHPVPREFWSVVSGKFSDDRR